MAESHLINFSTPTHPPPERWRFLLVKSTQIHSKLVKKDIVIRCYVWLTKRAKSKFHEFLNADKNGFSNTTRLGNGLGAKLKIGEIIFAGQKQQYVVVAPLASLREFQNEHMSWSKDHRHHHYRSHRLSSIWINHKSIFCELRLRQNRQHQYPMSIQFAAYREKHSRRNIVLLHVHVYLSSSSLHENTPT